MNEGKPAYKRTEIYGYGIPATIGAALASGQFNVDLINNLQGVVEQIPEITTAIVAVIEAVTNAVLRITGAVMTLKSGLSYGRGRVAVKKARVQKQ